MKRRTLILSIFSLIFFGLTSCSSIFTGIYGMKKTKAIDENTVAKFAKKYDVPAADSYNLIQPTFHIYSLLTLHNSNKS
ncbi:hypothetical protein PQZ52_02470 [Flavobacteriales bacterium]|nr:hypothetical protein [Flavobacteriales bacterium]